jgi:hypothetical protein
MSAVHFLRFPMGAPVHDALAGGSAARLVVSHPRYRAEVEIPPALREEMLSDLG